jgi:hypothetical protein
LEIIKPGHKCDPDLVKTMIDILENSRPCPKCGERIFRVSGCDQMFCVVCHVGFYYNTGEIITTPFHNPHRMEWLQNHKEDITEVCDRDCNIDVTFMRADKRISDKYDIYIKVMERVTNIQTHLRAHEEELYIIRVRYMLDNNKKNFETDIKESSNRFLCNTYVYEILRVCKENIRDVLWIYQQEMIFKNNRKFKSLEDYKRYESAGHDIWEKVKCIEDEINYANQCLLLLGKCFFNRKINIIE